MRILIAHEAIAGGGGVESYLAALVPALQQRGHALGFVHHHTRCEDGPIRLEFPGVPSFSVGDDGFDAVMRGLGVWGPEVCFSHNMRHLDVEAALAARWPTVKMMHGYFGTCVSGQKAHAFPGLTACSREFGAPCLALYLPRRCGTLRPAEMVRQYRWNVAQRGLFDRYARLVVASDHMRGEYLRHGVPPDRVLAVPLFPTIAAPAAPRPRPSEPTVLFAGRMTSLKGPRVLIEAVAGANRQLQRPIRLVMAGDGPERQRLVALAAARHVEAAFPGWVGEGEREALIRHATVLAVPSLWPEPFGLVGLEAGIHGVPAVGFDTGGISQWLRDGVNGRLVRDAGSPAALGRALAEVLGSAERLRTLEQGALTVAREMSLEAHLTRLEPALAGAAMQGARG